MQYDYPVLIVGGDLTGKFLWSTPHPSGLALFSDSGTEQKYRFNQQHGIVLGKFCLTNFVYLDGLQNLSTALVRRLQIAALNALESDNSQFIGIPKANSFMTHLAEWSGDLSPSQLSSFSTALNASVASQGEMIKVIDYLEYTYMAGYLQLRGKTVFEGAAHQQLNDVATLNERFSRVLHPQVLEFRKYLADKGEEWG